MVLYHKIESDKLASALRLGLAQGAGGDLSDDSIDKTDEFLNSFRSKAQLEKGVDRRTNLYCYLSEDDKIIDISSGERKNPKDIPQDSGHTLVCVTPRPEGCFVSDLDTYDQVKASLAENDTATAHKLAVAYWNKLVPLDKYDGSYRRPEVMLVYNVEPKDLAALGTN